MSFTHNFPAVSGIQAGRPFYLTVCPMKIIPKIFIFNEEEVPPELRAQRTLNTSRIPLIARYIIENEDSYVISAITASINKAVQFTPCGPEAEQSQLGVLHVPMDATILINDGQHRRAAIEEAIRQEPRVGNENVAVLFFIDEGLERSQQMFADLNKHAIRPSDSLSTLYDHRDPSSELARFVAMSVEGFRGMTEMEKSSISNRSTKLFTLSGLKHASRALLRKGRNEPISPEEKQIAKAFWAEVISNIPDWQRAKQRQVSSSDLRQNYVHAHGVALSALGAVGADLLAKHPKDWKKRLAGIQNLDWSRSNHELWEGRAMVLGKISKARSNVMLTANLIKQHLGMPLTPQEEQLEQQLEAS